MSRRRPHPHRLRRMERRRLRVPLPSSDPLGLRLQELNKSEAAAEAAVNEWARWPPPAVDLEDQQPAGPSAWTPNPADPRTLPAAPVLVHHISVNDVVLEARARSARPRDFPARIPLDRVSGPIPTLRVSIPRDRLQGLHFPPEDRICFLDGSRAATDEDENCENEHASPFRPKSDLAWILDGPQHSCKVGPFFRGADPIHPKGETDRLRPRVPVPLGSGRVIRAMTLASRGQGQVTAI